jgi:HEAT repeat protein
MKTLFTSKKTWLALFVLVVIAGGVWWQWQPILAWHHVRQLAGAYEENRESCANQVVQLDEAAVPQLLDGLRSKDALVCGNLQYALVLLTKKWSVTDPRSQRLLDRLHGQFDEFSVEGQEKVVLLVAGLLQQDGPRPLPPNLTNAASQVLVVAEKKAELRSPALLLAAELVECVESGQWVDACRHMAAVQLVRREAMRKDKELVERVIPLLRDPEPAVRRAALLTLASETEVVREEAFLPLLHDDDLQVQYLSELALRKRGLKDDDLAMARLISDKNPLTRLRVLHYLARMPEINLREWLRQLSHDPEPAVRAAAVGATALYPHVDMTQRLREMAERDPSDAVRENARYYLQLRSPRTALVD